MRVSELGAVADYLSYWRPSTVDREAGKLLRHAASDQYGTLHAGDTVWIVTAWPGGRLVLLGLIRVAWVTDKAEAEKRLGTTDVWRARHHIFPALGDAEPMREVPLADVADQMRFDSQKDRLTVVDGQVDAKQLQRMRRLTADTAHLLKTRWEEDAEVASRLEAIGQSGGGAGFGSTEANRQVEMAAIDYVMQRLGSEGWHVTSVEAAKKGYDLLATRGPDRRHVEVKGVRGVVPTFILTEGEFRRAESDPDFWLYCVTEALSEPHVHCLTGEEMLRAYRFVALAYRAVLAPDADGA